MVNIHQSRVVNIHHSKGRNPQACVENFGLESAIEANTVQEAEVGDVVISNAESLQPFHIVFERLINGVGFSDQIENAFSMGITRSALARIEVDIPDLGK